MIAHLSPSCLPIPQVWIEYPTNLSPWSGISAHLSHRCDMSAHQSFRSGMSAQCTPIT